MKKAIGFLLVFLIISNIYAQETTVKIGLLKYSGGGDWYANPTSLTNLIKFCNTELRTSINSDYEEVAVNSPNIFNYPFIHMTGHGNVIFSDSDVQNLKLYLKAGGFLHVDDNYGMDKFVRRELKKVFPNQELVELPITHAIYNQKYKFENGLPKIHVHDDKVPQGFGIFIDGRLVCFYTYESDLGDGWEDQDVHNDSQAIRTKALQMGANIVSYAFKN